MSALVWAAASAVVCLAAVAAGAALGATYDQLADAVRPYIRPTGAHRR